MSWIIAILDIIYRILVTLLHYVFAFVYGIYGRKVPPVKNPVLQMSATELAKKIRKRELTSETVIRAFIERITEVDPIINATVECRFADAIKEAKEADFLVASGILTEEELETEKPLLGVPFTVKVILTVKGLRCTAGCVLFKDLIAQKDSTAVLQMKEAGAIVLATTNCSEVGMNIQSSNYAHGVTSNPYDTSRTSGGSSGGESALIGAAGSVIGLGNDMAGSIRIPCMFTGIFGHKPTAGLVSNDCFPYPPSEAARMLISGPMCRYAEDLVTMMKILSIPEDKGFKFGEKVDFRSVKVYYFYTYGRVPLMEDVDPDIQDAVDKVVSQFEILGSKVKHVDIPLFQHSGPIFIQRLLSAVPDPAHSLTAGRLKLNGPLEILKKLCFQSNFTLLYIFSMNAHNVPLLYNPNTVDFYKKLENQLDAELHDLLDENSILVMPTMPFPAPYHNEIILKLGSSSYTNIFNVLEMPSTQCPVGFTKKGLPIGVQIVARRGNDHLTVACALEMEKAFGGWKPPS